MSEAINKLFYVEVRQKRERGSKQRKDLYVQYIVLAPNAGMARMAMSAERKGEFIDGGEIVCVEETSGKTHKVGEVKK